MAHKVIKTTNSTILSGASNIELSDRERFYALYEQCPIPKDQLLDNIGLFTRRQVLSRMLMFNDMYKKIVNLHGVICEFGVHWGKSLALFESFRGMYEPYNYNRKIIGFDTFKGFPSVHEKDGNSAIIEEGAYSTTENYENYLGEILKFHESESPVQHIQKFKLVKGDASITVKKYLEQNPETIIAFAYFDMDIYQPTKDVLEAIIPHLTKGAVIGFDQINMSSFPGETLAFKEVLGINKFKIHRDPNNPGPSYIIYE